MDSTLRPPAPAAHREPSWWDALFTQRWTPGILCALVILSVLYLQAYHFGERINYRDDEIRTVHAGMTMSVPEVVQWMSVDIHPPLWRVSATIWVSLFGPNEHLTRFLSSLYTALALALLYRLARDVFDAQIAVLATFILGMHALFFFYSHELRPYAALLMWTTALHIVFLRWVRRPTFRYTLLYVLLGAGALYTHFVALYVIAAQVVALVVLARFSLRRWLRATLMFALTGLAFAGWLPSLLHSVLVVRPSGITYGIDATLSSLPLIYSYVQVRPLALGNLMVGLSALVPVRWALGWRGQTRPFRFRQEWRRWYFILVAGVVLVGLFITDRFFDVLTQRNMLPAIPMLAVLAAFGLRALPWQARLLALLIVLNQAVGDFINYQSNQPYREAAAFILPEYEAGDPIIISVDSGTGSYFTYAYYLMDRAPGVVTQDSMFYLSLGEPDLNLPDPPLNHITDDDPESVRRFEALLEGQDTVWWIRRADSEPDYVSTYFERLAEDFELERRIVFSDIELRWDFTFLRFERQNADGGEG